MSKPVISVENLSKAYRIGSREEVPDTIMGAMKGILAAPFRNANRLRRLSTSKAGQGESDDEDILWALKDVSFEVHEGDVIGIIGRNGAGKSTLLKILSRITEPTSGRAVIRGRVSSLLEVGTGFHPELTGRDNIYMNGTILGMTKREIDRKFDEIVDFSGVEKFLDTPCKRYSSGMQVRLAFAVAAHLEPEILIIDEVLAVGDQEFQKKCLGKMQDVASSGRTVLFVSHNMSAMQNLCGRCILLQNGQAVANGDTATIIRHYLRLAGNNSHTVDLTAPEIKRNGNGRVLAKNVQLHSTNNVRTQHIPMGEGISITVSMGTTDHSTRAILAVAIFDSLGRRVCGLNSSDTQNAVFEISNKDLTTVQCLIPEMNLTTGTYYLNIVIQDPRSREILDRVTEAVSFEIIAADVYNTGKVPHGETVIFLPVKWEIIPNDTHDLNLL